MKCLGFFSLNFVQRFEVGFTTADRFNQSDEPVVFDGFFVRSIGLSDKKSVSVVR